MYPSQRQAVLWPRGEYFVPGKRASETKEHRLERVAAEMRRKYHGITFRERIIRGHRTRAARKLQQELPFDC